jgi:hypothetical protein
MFMSFRLALVAFLCFCATAALAQNDRIRISGIDAGEEVLVAVNARSASGQGCLDEQDQHRWRVYRTDNAGHAVLETNLRSGCVLTVVAFSKKRAMALKTFSKWTDRGGEVRTVTMKPLIDVPVVIWITDNALEEVAYGHVAKAAELYRENMVGFNLVPTFRNVSGKPAAVKIIDNAVVPRPDGLAGSDCGNVGSLKVRGGPYKPNMLNIYYVNRAGLHRNCAIRLTPECGQDPTDLTKFPKVDGNVTYIGSDSETLPVLAHELGHAFGLRPICNFGHPIFGPGLDTTNVMWNAGGDERVKFTLGQIFRLNTQKDPWGGTMIIANKLRPGPGRECRLATQEHYTHRCPPLNLTFETQ